jgi:hypothetical protein
MKTRKMEQAEAPRRRGDSGATKSARGVRKEPTRANSEDTSKSKGRSRASAGQTHKSQGDDAQQAKARRGRTQAKVGKEKLSEVGRGRTVAGLGAGAAKSTQVGNPKRSTTQQASKRAGARRVDGRGARG